MRRPLWFRALIAIWGLWFTAALTEAPGLHTCAVHSDHSAVHGRDMHAAHGGHEGHSAQMPAGSTDGSPPHAPTDCTCLGVSCCAAAVVTPSRPIDLPAAVIVAGRAATFADVATPVVRRAYTLPFANGPPTA